MFLDEAIIDVSGGNGGNGCVAWRREKYVPEGGPDGGDGGKGGDIIFLADPNTDTLSDFLSSKRFKAANGENGLGKNCNGHGGDDLILRVPPGTVITLVNKENPISNGEILADLDTAEQRVVIAHGGRGGFGNTHFKSSTRQAPDFAELGEPGEQITVKLELKLVADIGIIGFPSVGKSSLIAAVSSAKPKVAAYEFTTLVPNLGVVKVFDREFVLCDIPGIIDGASEGKGLGDKFLRHIERCGILIHLLDINRPDIVEDYRVIRKELKAYSPALAKKPEVVVLNKIDLVGGDVKPFTDELKKKKISVFASISSATTQGTAELMQRLLPLVLEYKGTREKIITAESAVQMEKMPVLRPHLNSQQMGRYQIEERSDRIVITGKRIEQFTAMTNFSSPGARQRFADVIERIGLKKTLEKMSYSDQKVFIGKVQVDEYL